MICRARGLCVPIATLERRSPRAVSGTLPGQGVEESETRAGADPLLAPKLGSLAAWRQLSTNVSQHSAGNSRALSLSPPWLLPRRMQDIPLWMSPSEAPKAMQASGCNQLPKTRQPVTCTCVLHFDHTHAGRIVRRSHLSSHRLRP